MKVAIPTFGDRVSPRFDCAQSFLIVAVPPHDDSAPDRLAAWDWASHERVKRLLALGVDTVVCGGIDCQSLESLEASGVTVYGRQAGQVSQALDALIRGELDSRSGRGQSRCGRRPHGSTTEAENRHE